MWNLPSASALYFSSPGGGCSPLLLLHFFRHFRLGGARLLSEFVGSLLQYLVGHRAAGELRRQLEEVLSNLFRRGAEQALHALPDLMDIKLEDGPALQFVFVGLMLLQK